MKKLLSIVLVLSMLLGTMLLAFTSCKEEEAQTDNPSHTSKNNENTEVIEGDIFSERAVVDDELGEWDFKGKTLRVVAHNDGFEMFSPEEEINKGDLIKDAKAQRNKAVEDRLNCNIELVYSAGIVQLNEYLSKTILSGTDEFDLVVHHVLQAGNIIPKNLFLNWYDIPHVDFSKPWWVASNATELTYDGKCIMAISDINATSIMSCCAIIFNKTLANAYDMGNLYDIVLSGDWTYDVFYNLIKDIWIDQDGNGVASSGDFFGGRFSTGALANAWLWAFDNPVVQKNEEGVPTIAIKTPKINSIMQTLYDLLYNTTGNYSGPVDGKNLFLSKQAIFSMIFLKHVTDKEYRDFDDDYGILPLPKWDENQNSYYSHVMGESTASMIPKTATDLEFIGVCTELLAAESWKTLTPTIYEIALKTRYLRDDESKKVLDIILDNRFYDFGFVYDNWQGFAYTVDFMLGDKIQNFESYYAKRYNSARTQLKRVLRAFDKLD